MTPTARMERVRELFDQALELPPHQRRAFLEQACSDDRDLLTEVLDLVALDAGDVVSAASPAVGMEWLARQVFSSDAPAPLPKTIGEFRVVREIGRGGMGVVYEASQDRLDRRVAIKVIHAGLLSPGALGRFHRETRAMAALTHPGIVPLFHAGVDTVAPGVTRPYVVMELVQGPSLREYLQSHTPNLDERLRVLVDLCDAVHHAHTKGIVHRDLKPENILLSLPDASVPASQGLVHARPQPKILDFGVSRLLEDDRVDTHVTREGQVVGTPPYLSPEQAEGDALSADTRSDVYALGVIAFEMLAGSLPFDVRGMTTTAAIRVVLNTPPAKLRSVAPNLHPDLHTIVHKAMHRDPQQRYASAAEFGADVARFLAHQPVLARAPSWSYVTSRFVRRHRVLTGVIAGSCVLIAVSVVAMALAWADARRTREAAVWQRYLSAMSAASVALAGGDIATARRELEATPPEHRGWEFKHLVSRLDQSRRCVRVSFPPPFVTPNVPGLGTAIVNTTSAGMLRDNNARVEPLDPNLRLWLAAHASVFPAPMSGIDDTIAWLDSDGTTLRHTRPLRWPDWPVEFVYEASLSRDGSTIALRIGGANSSKHAVVTARLSDGEGAYFPLTKTDQASRLVLNTDGSKLAMVAGGEDPIPATVRFFNARTGQMLGQLPPLSRAASSLVFSVDGSVLFLVLQSGVLEKWDLSVPTPELIARRTELQDAPRNLCLSRDGTRLIGASRDGLVRIYDASTLELIADLVGHESEIFGLGFDSSGTSIISTGTDATIRTWDLNPPPPRPLVLRGHTKLVHPIALAESRRQVFTGSWDNTVAVYSLDTGERLAQVTLDAFVQHLVLSPDERVLAVREFQRPLRLLDAKTLATLREIPGGDGDVFPLFDRSSTRVTVALQPRTRTALVADISSGAVSELSFDKLADFPGPTIDHRAGLLAVSQVRDGKTCTVMYSLHDGQEKWSRPCRQIAFESMAFAPDGKTFAIVSPTADIDLIDARTFRTLGTFHGHTREVLALVFSPDGSRLFSADLTGVIRIWDTRTCAEVGQLRGHTSHIRRLSISADGKSLISGSHDATARVWSIP